MKGSSGPCFRPYYVLTELYRRDCPFVAALRPTDGQAEIEWYDPQQADTCAAVLTREGQPAVTVPLSAAENRFVLSLENGVEYELEIVDTAAPSRRSARRKVKCGPVCGFPVNYLSPKDDVYAFSGSALCSPGLVKLSDGRLLLSMDVYRARGGQNLSMLYESSDGGVTWRYITDFFPCFWGKIFEHRGKLYMLSMTTEYGDLQIACSADGGYAWSPFIRLFPGSGNRDVGGPHKAPMNILCYRGRLWTAIDYGTWEKKTYHWSGVLSAAEDADLTDPSSWTLTPFLPWETTWPGAAAVARGCLEGNMVVLPDGHLYNCLRYQIQPEYNRVVLLRVDTAHPEAPLSFYKIIDMIGGLTKFSIVYDEQSGWYLSIGNRVLDPEKPTARNMLSLSKSRDGENWTFVCDLVDDSFRNVDVNLVGVQYPDAVIDGADLIWAQRTACNQAANFHDSNYITFHRLADFRSLL